ncbi:MAG: serine hydrolase, partial [Myxococcales bacterium]|nr:serine hydrolase [Myxococcales bacterium]
MKRNLIERKLGKVDRALAKAIEGAETAGAVLLAKQRREGEWLKHEAVAGLAVAKPDRVPMQRDSVFDLASLTKPIATTTAIMLLIADGKVALEDPVAKHIPAFAEREKDAVTVRHLLTHSSGLRPWRGYHELLLEKERKRGERWMCTEEGRAFILERVIKSALVHEPGTAAVYGDLDFIALGAVVEAVSGERLDAFCRERIFEPLGLTETSFRPLGDDAPEALPRARIAATEECPFRERVVWGEVHDPNAYAMGGVAGHAGLFAPAADVMRFAEVVLEVWHGRSELLPRELVRNFATRQKLPPESDWALGWDTPTAGVSSSGQYFSAASIGHLGFTGTSLWIDLEREAIVVFLTNRIHLVAKRSRYAL